MLFSAFRMNESDFNKYESAAERLADDLGLDESEHISLAETLEELNKQNQFVQRLAYQVVNEIKYFKRN